MKVIDGHCHVGTGFLKKQSPETLLSNMDNNEIDMAVICPVEEYIVFDNHAGNQFILECQRAHPDRFVGFAVANPWSGIKGCEELRWGLDEGLRGVKFNTSIQGCFINDQIVYPLIEVAARFDVPVYFHVGTPIYSLPLQLKYLAEDFPTVNFILGHGGYADSWTDILPACKNTKNIFFETSFVSLSLASPELKVLGVDRIIFGSDTPVSSLRAEKEKIMSIGLEKDELALVLGGNIERLLNN